MDILKEQINRAKELMGTLNEQEKSSDVSTEELKTLLHDWTTGIIESTDGIDAFYACRWGKMDNTIAKRLLSTFSRAKELEEALTLNEELMKKIKTEYLGGRWGQTSEEEVWLRALATYLCTANNGDYDGDWNIIDPKFPEFGF